MIRNIINLVHFSILEFYSKMLLGSQLLEIEQLIRTKEMYMK